MNTGTEPYWIALLTNNYSAYMCVHARTGSWWSVNIWGHTPDIHSLAWFNPGLNYRGICTIFWILIPLLTYRHVHIVASHVQN